MLVLTADFLLDGFDLLGIFLWSLYVTPALLSLEDAIIGRIIVATENMWDSAPREDFLHQPSFKFILKQDYFLHGVGAKKLPTGVRLSLCASLHREFTYCHPKVKHISLILGIRKDKVVALVRRLNWPIWGREPVATTARGEAKREKITHNHHLTEAIFKTRIDQCSCCPYGSGAMGFVHNLCLMCGGHKNCHDWACSHGEFLCKAYHRALSQQTTD